MRFSKASFHLTFCTAPISSASPSASDPEERILGMLSNLRGAARAGERACRGLLERRGGREGIDRRSKGMMEGFAKEKDGGSESHKWVDVRACVRAGWLAGGACVRAGERTRPTEGGTRGRREGRMEGRTLRRECLA